jgi:hypothetical protein
MDKKGRRDGIGYGSQSLRERIREVSKKPSPIKSRSICDAPAIG